MPPSSRGGHFKTKPAIEGQLQNGPTGNIHPRQHGVKNCGFTGFFAAGGQKGFVVLGILSRTHDFRRRRAWQTAAARRGGGVPAGGAHSPGAWVLAGAAVFCQLGGPRRLQTVPTRSKKRKVESSKGIQKM